MNITKTAMVTICGRPNVGKSTLTNALAGQKLAIVSAKPQTTRNRITAVVNRSGTQFVIMDTPGFHRPRTKLGDYMVNVVRESIPDVELVLLLAEPIPNVGEQEAALIESIRAANIPAILVLNKIDTVEKERLLEVMSVYSAAFDWAAILPISALRRDGTEELLNEMEKYAAPGPPLFPEDVDTAQPDRAPSWCGKSCWAFWTRRCPMAPPWRSPASPSGTTASLTWMLRSTARRPATRALLSARAARR